MYCSICATTKRQTNNWWRMYYCFSSLPKERWISVESLEAAELSPHLPHLILCGTGCLMKAASAVLSGQMPRLKDAEGMPVNA